MARVFAWSGALLFALSVAVFLFHYVFRFRDAATSGDAARAITSNVLLFTLFAAHHSVFARERVRAAVGRCVPAELERSLYVWVASLIFLAVVLFWQPVPGVAWQVDGLARWALRILWLFGLWLTLRSAAVLDIRELAGLTRPALPAAGDHVYRTTGPYGWVRHPIYTGWFLLVFAVSPMTMTRLVFATISGAYLLVAIPLEERTLRTTSSGAYDRYIAAVRWKLVPGVY